VGLALEPEESPLLEDFDELDESEEGFDEPEESEEEELPLSPVLDFPSVVLDPLEDSDFIACLRDSDG
jgi:hypothetical protein